MAFPLNPWLGFPSNHRVTYLFAPGWRAHVNPQENMVPGVCDVCGLWIPIKTYAVLVIFAFFLSKYDSWISLRVLIKVYLILSYLILYHHSRMKFSVHCPVKEDVENHTAINPPLMQCNTIWTLDFNTSIKSLRDKHIRQLDDLVITALEKVPFLCGFLVSGNKVFVWPSVAMPQALWGNVVFFFPLSAIGDSFR